MELLFELDRLPVLTDDPLPDQPCIVTNSHGCRSLSVPLGLNPRPIVGYTDDHQVVPPFFLDDRTAFNVWGATTIRLRFPSI